MNKLEILKKIIAGEKIEYIPTAFWLHFDKSKIKTLEENFNEHKKFLEETNVDILKIMNEFEFRRSVKVLRASDWDSIGVYTKDSYEISEQKKLIEKVLKELKDKAVYFGTIHGVLASLSHSSGYKYSVSYKLFKEHFNNNPDKIKSALEKITESTINLIRENIKAGVDGIYYASLGGEIEKYSDEDFEKFIKPFELMVLKEINSYNKISILHMCKHNINIHRYKDYKADIYNWSVNNSDYSLEDGYNLFKEKVMLGGFEDRSGVLVNGSNEEIKIYTRYLVNKMKNKKFILGADCTLPTDINRDKIRVINNFKEML